MDGSQRAALVVAAAGATAEVTATVAGMHGAIHRRIGAALGPLALPMAIHRLHTQAIYRTIGAAARAVRLAGGLVVHRLESNRLAHEPRPAEPALFSALSCAFGDHMVGAVASLAPTLGIHHQGQAIEPDPLPLRRAFGPGTGRVVLFLHGLGDTERGWSARGHLPEVVERTGTHTPLLIRYNSGLHVSENGELLADLLTRLQWAWPRPIEEIIFVGHSMGGLVVRSACEQARRRGLAWQHLVSHVFYLGAPHFGSGIERLAAAGLARLERLPDAMPLVRLANRRSAGIKDLRHGSLMAEDWEGHPDERWDARHLDVPLLAQARHHQVGAALLPERLSGADHWVGDIMVPLASALGSRPGVSRKALPQRDIHVLRGSTHPGLLGHPGTHALLERHLRS